MKKITTLLFGFALCTFWSCEQTTDPEQIKLLYQKSVEAGTDGFCISDHETADRYEEISSIIRDLDYVCYQLIYNATGDLPDSVLVLNRTNINGTKTVLYDFAKRNRELDTWNREEGYDKSEKIAEDVYVRTYKVD